MSFSLTFILTFAKFSATVQMMDKVDLMLKLLEEFREETNRRFEQIDKRFEQVDDRFNALQAENNRRFEQIDKRFEQVDRQFEQVREEFRQTKELIKDEGHAREKMEDKLEKVYETRHEVEYKISRDFIIILLHKKRSPNLYNAAKLGNLLSERIRC